MGKRSPGASGAPAEYNGHSQQEAAAAVHDLSTSFLWQRKEISDGADHETRDATRPAARSPDAVSVSGTLTGSDGSKHAITFAFERFVARTRYTDADLAVAIDGVLVYKVRAPIDSIGEQERLARMLERMYPADGAGWVQLINVACGKARDAHLSAAVAVPIDSIPVNFEDHYLVEGVVPLSGVTILYGQGGFAKGWIAHALANAIGAGDPFLGRDTKQCPVLYLDYEDTQQVARRRNVRLGLSESAPQTAPGSLLWMPGRGIPVVEQMETIRRELRKNGAGVMIVDSALPALGGNASDAEAVSRLMYHALDTLEVPVILIAHVNRADDDRYPFGSIYWHNAARMTWNVKRSDSEDSPDIQIALTHKKANNGRKQPSFGIKLRFDDPDGAVDVLSCDVKNVLDQLSVEKAPSISDHIWELLTDGPKTATELAAALPMGQSGNRPTANHVRDQLGRMLGYARFDGLEKVEKAGKRGMVKLWSRSTSHSTPAEQGTFEEYE